MEHIASVDQTSLLLHQGFNVFLAFGFATYISPWEAPQPIQLFSSGQGRQSQRCWQDRYLHESMATKSHWSLSDGPCQVQKCAAFSGADALWKQLSMK